MAYREILKRNGLRPLLWTVVAELHRSIIVRNRITGEIRVLDTK